MTNKLFGILSPRNSLIYLTILLFFTGTTAKPNADLQIQGIYLGQPRKDVIELKGIPNAISYLNKNMNQVRKSGAIYKSDYFSDIGSYGDIYEYSNDYTNLDVRFSQSGFNSVVRSVSCKYRKEFSEYLDAQILYVNVNEQLPEYQRSLTPIQTRENIKSMIIKANCSINGIEIKDKESQVLEKIGKPQKIDNFTTADGTVEKLYNYSGTKGQIIRLILKKSEEETNYRVHSIVIISPENH
jgi:hypothetical protein